MDVILDQAQIAERDRQIYDRAYSFLIDKLARQTPQLGLQPRDAIECHLRPPDKPETLAGIYRRLAESAANRASMPNVIIKALPSRSLDDLRPVLFDFMPSKVATKYEDWTSLFHCIQNDLRPTGALRITNQSLWPLYCRSLIGAAQFLSQFVDSEDFYHWTSLFADDPRARVALPLTVSFAIPGIGFALACDFLKELGFAEFGKPDTHIKDIFLQAGLVSDRGDSSVFNAIQRVARNTGTSPYAVDKLFWLIGSGSFYRLNFSIQRAKKEFLEEELVTASRLN